MKTNRRRFKSGTRTLSRIALLPAGRIVRVVLVLLCGHALAADPLRWLVRVDPVEIGARSRDEMPAEVGVDVGKDRAMDPASLRILRVDATGKPSAPDEPLPFRWYDDAIPYDFPEFIGSVSSTQGELRPKPSERGGYYLNAMGDGHKGRLAWMHTQIGREPAWYAVEARLLAPGETPKQLPPQGWIGDGQARCAPVATQAVHSDHLRVDLDDWNGDGLMDLITGDDFGHVVWWPNLGTRQSPQFAYCRLILDAAGQPLDVGTNAAVKVCDWDSDGDRDLLIGTNRNRIVWFENTGTDRERKLKYRGLVMLDGRPLELPVTPLTRGSPAIFNLDYYPVIEVCDWDGDGDDDLLAGGYITGCVFLYENTGAKRGLPPQLVARGPIESDGIVLNVEHWGATPCAVDLDGDGDLDLLSGHVSMGQPGNKAGLRYFENTGSKTAPKLRSAKLDAPTLGKITLGSPRAFDWDGDGDFDLVIAVRTNLLLLENTGGKTAPRFEKAPVFILPAWGPAPVMADQLLDWNGDGRTDLVNGFTVRLNGGAKNPWDWPQIVQVLPRGVKIEHRSGIGDEEHSTLLDDFDSDGAIDVLFGDWFGHVWWHRNRGTSAKPDFDLAGLRLLLRDGSPIKVGPVGGDTTKDFNALQGARTVVAAGDFDGDGLRDLVVGDTFGKVRFFRQSPVASRQSKDAPVFAEPVEIGNLGIRLNVCATDWNQDGRPDIISGAANGNVQIFLNSPVAGRPSPFAPGFTPKLPPIMQPRVLLGDLNGDGDDDLYFPSTQGACFVERSFLNHGYARGAIVEARK